MAWEQLSINKPHLVYIILGGFTSIFMLCSLFIKEKMYIGEATVATLCGVIFGPHAANLINPLTWGNTDQVTLEFSRIVLVVQCFAVGVELPKAYMERHWRSVVFLLVPVMTFGWLITSLFVWWMIEPLSWLESLVVAACVTATDPVLASSVVGKGKFAKRVPKHLRDVLSAESGCNDGMAFPFIYLSLYLLRYDLSAREVVFHWTCFTILYECIFGAFYGVMVGYLGRHAIKFAERKGLIDRESFLVFYFVLALFCAGSGSMLGMDDLLIGFAAGVGFSNDGWFTEKTEESHVSNVIDLLLNLAYFVYFGTIIPWEQYNAPEHGLVPWRLVVISIFVILFRRIPAMLAFKPFIPDIKTWREALFAGHFGPIGVGAIFVAILARAELETETAEPLSSLPAPGSREYNLIYLVWPLVTFMVISSILVHGSSIAVFTLGKRINTLTITLSYTQDNDRGPAWMNRLPRISSQSKSMSRMDSSDFEEKEGPLGVPPGELPPIGIPKLHLRRQKEEEDEKRPSGSRSSSLRPSRRRKRKTWDATAIGPGGPISESAIRPARLSEAVLSQQESGSDTLLEKSGEPSPESGPPGGLATGSVTSSSERPPLEAEHEAGPRHRSESHSPYRPAQVEAYMEGDDDLIVEDEEGNVIETVDVAGMADEDKAAAIEKARNELSWDESGNFAKQKHQPHEKSEGEEIENEIKELVEHPQKVLRKTLDQWKGFSRHNEEEGEPSRGEPRKEHHERKRGPAHAYQFGNTVIVEDEDGEVIRKYTLPNSERPGERKRTYGEQQMRHGLQRVSTWVGLGRQNGVAGPDATTSAAAATTSATNADLADAKPTRKVGEEQGATGGKKAGRPRRDSDDLSEDDGLRMTISGAERYGLTGQQKGKGHDPAGMMSLGSGRRLSTKDFIRQIQRLDPKSKIQEINESDAPEHVKREIRHEAKVEEAGRTSGPGARDRPRGLRIETEHVSGGISAKRPDVGRRGQTEGFQEPEDYFSPRSRPRPEHGATAERMESRKGDGSEDEEEEEEEADIPTHDVRVSLAKHGKGQTAADMRRRRLATIRSDDEADNGEDDDEAETAAEKRRRLAALGLGGRDEDTSESDEEEDGAEHRRPRPEAAAAVQEPGVAGGRPSAAPRQHTGKKIQWGGEKGREREREEGDRTSPGDGVAHVARRVKGIFKHRER